MIPMLKFYLLASEISKIELNENDIIIDRQSKIAKKL